MQIENWNTRQVTKIFRFSFQQQPAALAELYSHANPDGERPPPDAASTMATHNYLSACKLVFEDGLLRSNNRYHDGSTKVTDMDSPVLRNINEGFNFFKTWFNNLNQESKYRTSTKFELKHLIVRIENRFWQLEFILIW